MTAIDIIGYDMINDTDEVKVNELAESMLENGWIGCPILTCGNTLVTGSHRLAAIQKIFEMVENGEIENAEVLSQNIAEDVSEIVEAAVATRNEEYGFDVPVDYSDIGWMFEGTWVEEYSSEIEEW